MATVRTVKVKTLNGVGYFGLIDIDHSDWNNLENQIHPWRSASAYGPIPSSDIVSKGSGVAIMTRIDYGNHHTSYGLPFQTSLLYAEGSYETMNPDPSTKIPQYKEVQRYTSLSNPEKSLKIVSSWSGYKETLLTTKKCSIYRYLYSFKGEATQFTCLPLATCKTPQESSLTDIDEAGAFSECVSNMPAYYVPFIVPIKDTQTTTNNNFKRYYIVWLARYNNNWYYTTQVYSEAFSTIMGDPATYTFNEDDYPDYGDDGDGDGPNNDDNPYADDGDSDGGGGGGDYDPSGDGDDDDPSGTKPPNVSIQDTSFCTIFNPSLSQLKALASFMWSNSFYDNILKLWADPMDVILGLSMVPFAVPDGTSGVVKVGNVSTGITMTKAASQYVEVDCGSRRINEYFGSCLDYSPYTKLSIYLPYIGIKPLGDECMNATISVKYNCDIVSGACICFVRVSNSNNGVLYTYQGQCAENIPVTGENFTRLIQSTMGLAGAAGLAMATAGASAPVSAAMIAGGLASSASAVASGKPDFERSGNISASAGFMGIQYPYIIIERPKAQVAFAENAFTGYPSHETVQVKNVNGFAAFENVLLEGVKATESEKAELIQLLTEGVILP